MKRETPFPEGIKPGDFVQFCNHFGDIFFEVVYVIAPRDGSDYWAITYVQFDKYGSHPRKVWAGSGGSNVRRVISAEMAVPTIIAKHNRFHALSGQFDPFYGFVPTGTPLRKREDW